MPVVVPSEPIGVLADARRECTPDVVDGRAGLHLHLAQLEVTLVELEAFRDGTAWIDDTRIPGCQR